MSDADRMRKQVHAAFRFLLDIDGKSQAAFTECTLPDIEWETEEIKEGGLNTFTHLLPGRRKGGKISLKNGIGKSELIDWYISAMSEQFSRKPVTVTLLDVSFKPVISWHLDRAFPIRWSGPQIRSDANTVAIQSLDLACGEITVRLA